MEGGLVSYTDDGRARMSGYEVVVSTMQEFCQRLVELLGQHPGTEFNISMDDDRTRIVIWGLDRSEPYLEVGLQGIEWKPDLSNWSCGVTFHMKP